MEEIKNEDIKKPEPSFETIEPQRAQSEKTPKKSRFVWVIMLLAIIVLSSFFGAVFGFMSGNITQKFFPNVFKNTAVPGAGITKQQVVQEDSAVIDVVKKAQPAVVSIIISKDIPKIQDFFTDPFDFPNFLNPFENPGSTAPNSGQSQGGTEKKQIGGGSGFIISQDGMIVTNKHVVDDTSADYTVITSDGKTHTAKVVAKDPVNDIAVVKIDGTGYPTLTFGNSDSLQIGQTTVAIGNSLGEFTNTVSKGIISGLKRNLTAGGGLEATTEQLSDIIQTDAAINPGNSGGPLLDINGDVIGVNVAMAQGAQNIGFAIPSNQIKKIADQVAATGKISTPYLGVRYIPIDATIQQENNLPFNYGALVLRGQKMTDFAVIPGSPADKAGIVENDIILEINGTKVDSANSLENLIAKNNVGDTITLKVWHKGDTKDAQVALGELKQ